MTGAAHKRIKIKINQSINKGLQLRNSYYLETFLEGVSSVHTLTLKRKAVTKLK